MYYCLRYDGVSSKESYVVCVLYICERVPLEAFRPHKRDWPNPRAQGARHYCLTTDAAVHSRCPLSSTKLFSFKGILAVLNNVPMVTINRWVMGMCGFKNGTTSPPDRLALRSLVVRGVAALCLAAPPWPFLRLHLVERSSSHCSPRDHCRTQARPLRQGTSICLAARWLKSLEREYADRKVRGSNPTSASRLPLSRLGQPGSLSTLVLPLGSMAARHRKDVTAERLFFSNSFFDRTTECLAQFRRRSAVAPFRYLTAMPPEGCTRAGILPGFSSLAKRNREAEVGFEPRTFRSVNSRSNHLDHLAQLEFALSNTSKSLMKSLHFRGARWLKWLEREFTDRKVRGPNLTSASRLPLSGLEQPDNIPALVLPSGGMLARHRKGVTAEQLTFQSEIHSSANKFGFARESPGTQLNFSFLMPPGN
ncbi:hypothetical protein CSKR_109759 [Clonorchis sinensis]|uniref:Uncharacterized protein n=1 Tax=Clonorchis sinensis TaxID=79923 RepID=A0A419QDK3_CLOSI|nr:hypothetical protein CSKR_109759 [Clonorchis sinensis]